MTGSKLLKDMTASKSRNPLVEWRDSGLGKERVRSNQRVRMQMLQTRKVRRMSNFGFVPRAPLERVRVEHWDVFRDDDHPEKMNLGIEAYCGDDGKPYTMDIVRQAEERLWMEDLDKEYTRLDGLEDFTQATASWLLGENNPALEEDRVVTVQSLAGSGALRLAAEFMKKFLPNVTVYLSDPTSANHKSIFSEVGIRWKMYRYFDLNTTGLDFAGMMEDIEAAPECSVILLHGCAHSPTGIDPTKEQWNEIADLCIKKNHFPFFDVAYQGFATGSLDKDAYAPRLFVEKGLEIMVAQSYSKNLGLYAEAVGSLTFVVSDSSVGARIRSQMKRIVMGLHCFLPVHGARIVTEILKDSRLKAEWIEEIRTMTQKLQTTRSCLHDCLSGQTSDRDWSSILSQKGLFSYFNLSPAQIELMRTKHHIYATHDGRFSLSGLSFDGVAGVADAIFDLVVTHEQA